MLWYNQGMILCDQCGRDYQILDVSGAWCGRKQCKRIYRTPAIDAPNVVGQVYRSRHGIPDQTQPTITTRAGLPTTIV